MSIRISLLMSLAALIIAVPVSAQSPFSSSSTIPDIIFDEQLTVLDSAVALTWDGTHYWTGIGGGFTGFRLGQYTSAGTLVNVFIPGIDFRSLSMFSGQVHSRGFASPRIRPMTSPGVFGVGFNLLPGGTLGTQGDVVFDGTQFVTNNNGTVQRWDTTGNFLGTTALVGWGVNGENGGNQQFMMTTGNGFWLTFASATQELSAWDTATGTRLGTTVLVGAGADDLDSFSLSFGNDRVWLNEDAFNNGNWQGFPVFVSMPILAGDYSQNGFVDAADYTMWRDNVGAAAGTLPNDPVGGVIGPAQYTQWVQNFGNSGSMTALSAATSVPEPASVVLAIVLFGLLRFIPRLTRFGESGDTHPSQ